MASPKIQIKRGTTFPISHSFKTGELALNSGSVALYAAIADNAGSSAATAIEDPGTFTLAVTAVSATVSDGYTGVITGTASGTFVAIPKGSVIAVTGGTGSIANLSVVTTAATTLDATTLNVMITGGTPTGGTLTGITYAAGLKWVGAEIEDSPATFGSRSKLGTQGAIKDYISSLGVGSGDMLLGTAQTVTAAKTFNTGTLKLANSTSGTTTLNSGGVSTERTITLPDAAGTVALTANKLSVFAATTSAELAGVISDETGSGVLVFATSPTLVTPTLGVASATSINKVTITAPATGSTITVAEGKTLTASNTLTFTGTDSSTVAFGAGGTVVYTSGLGTNVATFLATPSSANLISAITDETGSGALVFANTPTLVTPNIGAATGTSLVLSGDLTVNGTTTTINSSTLTVDDKNIELGSVVSVTVSSSGTIGTVSGSGPWTFTITGMSSTSGLIVGSAITRVSGTGVLSNGGTCIVTNIVSSTSVDCTTTGGTSPTAGPITTIVTGGVTDTTADGGGITLKGATDKTILWDTTNSNWTLSENVNIPTGKVFKINNTSVLSATTLGSAVVSSSLTSVGTLSALTVNGSNVNGISFTKSGYHTSNSAVTIYNNNADDQNTNGVSAPPTLVLKAAHELDGPSFENVIRFENVDVDIGQIGIDNSKTFFFSAVRGTRNFSVTNTGVVEDCTIDCGTYT